MEGPVDPSELEYLSVYIYRVNTKSQTYLGIFALSSSQKGRSKSELFAPFDALAFSRTVQNLCDGGQPLSTELGDM